MPSEKPDNPFCIDQDDLAGEWLQMSKRTRDASRREADARHEHDQAKARLAVCRARLSLQIRKDPGKYDLPESKSPSNDVVDATVEVQTEYQKLQDAVFIAKRNMDYATADTEAFLTQRKALERLVELLQMNYWAEREPRPMSQGSRDMMMDRRHHAAHGGGIDPNE